VCVWGRLVLFRGWCFFRVVGVLFGVLFGALFGVVFFWMFLLLCPYQVWDRYVHTCMCQCEVVLHASILDTLVVGALLLIAK
jgi:hypothetical protein